MCDIIAPRNYAPGDLVHEEEPFVHVLRRSLKDTLCEACLKRTLVLKACKQCRAVKYCNKVCQKIDWKDHKYECKHLKNLTKDSKEDFVRFLGKVILKIKDKKWKTVQKRVLQTVKSFDDLDSHSKYLKEDPIMKLFCKEMNALTRKYIGDENMPDEDDFIEILGKVKYNVFQDNLMTSSSGYYLFIGGSSNQSLLDVAHKIFKPDAIYKQDLTSTVAANVEHDCIPNCNVDVRENVVKVWPMKKISRGSKITVKYSRIFSTKSLLMDDEFLKNCKCKECIKPYGESILTSLIDETRAYSVITETENILGFANSLDMIGVDHITFADLVDELLGKQREILVPTHHLHLKTLALRCFIIGGHPLEMKLILKELENNMKLVYGEFYLEMSKLYEKMIQANSLFGNPIEGMFYIKKLVKTIPFAINREFIPGNIFCVPDLFC